MKYLGATSPIETVQVAQGVSAHATAVKVTRNHTVKLYGKVLPKGSGTYVTLQQYVHGAWHYVKKVKIKYQHMPTGGSYTGFLIAYTSRTAGTKSLRVLHAATSKNLAGHSTTRKIRFV
jgi:hypothetical protein